MAQLAVVAALLAGCASTAGGPGGAMALGERTPPPPGFVDFCARQPGECGLTIQARGDGEGLQPARLRAALYHRFVWSVAFGAPGEELRTAAAPQAGAPQITSLADAAPPLPTGQLAYALRGQPAAEPVAWRAAPAAPQAAVPAAAPESDDAAIEETRTAPQLLPVSPALLDELNMVNRIINQAIVFATDLETYGVEDYWAEPLEAGIRRGDCEDYALEKRRALIARGVPSSALSIAVVRTSRGEGHAVLLVATDQGELVLDSLSPYIVSWQQAPYAWVERQAPGQPMVWVATGSNPRTLPVTQTAAPLRLAPAAG